MISSKQELMEYISADLEPFRYTTFKKKMLSFLFRDINSYRFRYLIHLRKLEYYSRKPYRYFIFCLYHKYFKNRIALILNWEIPCNVFGPGLHPWHPNIVVNGDVKAGKNCLLHGNNCIGRKSGIHDNNSCPILGDNVELGFNSSIFGNIKIGDNVIVGANSLVIRSSNDNVTLVGSPAREISNVDR